MAQQLPEPGQVFLDHVAHFVPRIDDAAAALEGCGFRLTPCTVQTNRADGAAVPAGTGNRCAMLRRGYLELLTATTDTPLAQQLRQRIAHHTGLHLAAFGSADAAAEHRRLSAAGFATLPLVDMRRPVTTAAGTEEARFTIARIAEGQMPEGRTQFLTHHTEALVWRPDYLDHPNGARALTALWLAAEDADEPAARFARFTGRAARRDGALTTIALDRGALHIAPPDYLREEFGVVPGGSMPCFVAAQVAVDSLDVLSARLDHAGIARRAVRLPTVGGGIAATLPPALGDALLFHAV